MELKGLISTGCLKTMDSPSQMISTMSVQMCCTPGKFGCFVTDVIGVLLLGKIVHIFDQL